MTGGSLSRRYARALIELGKEDGLVERFGDELEAFVTAIKSNPSILETLSNQWLNYNDRLKAIEQIADKSGLHPLLKNFLLILLKKERLEILPDISREYGRSRDVILNILRVVITTPQQPEASLLSDIEKMLTAKLKKKVIARGMASPEMIGGVTLKLDHTIYDGSIKRELERMKETLLK